MPTKYLSKIRYHFLTASACCGILSFTTACHGLNKYGMDKAGTSSQGKKRKKTDTVVDTQTATKKPKKGLKEYSTDLYKLLESSLAILPTIYLDDIIEWLNKDNSDLNLKNEALLSFIDFIVENGYDKKGLNELIGYNFVDLTVQVNKSLVDQNVAALVQVAGGTGHEEIVKILQNYGNSGSYAKKLKELSSHKKSPCLTRDQQDAYNFELSFIRAFLQFVSHRKRFNRIKKEIIKIIEESNDILNDILNEVNLDGNTPFHRSLHCSNKELAKIILKKKPPVGTKNNIGQTPLHVAAVYCNQEEDQEIIKMIINLGGDINALDHNGQTAIMLAADYINYPASKSLLEHNPNLDIKYEKKECIEYRQGAKKIKKEILKKETVFDIAKNPQFIYNGLSEDKEKILNALDEFIKNSNKK